jgi:CheY-like chemotaxis protein
MPEDKTVILCVDDEENPLVLRKLVLEKMGYKVITAASAEQALGILSTRHVDLVLSDHLMPGATGTELARQIKAAWPTLPVVLLSGVNEIPADADSADLFLSKVEGPAVLRESIAAVLADYGRRRDHESLVVSPAENNVLGGI